MHFHLDGPTITCAWFAFDSQVGSVPLMSSVLSDTSLPFVLWWVLIGMEKLCTRIGRAKNSCTISLEPRQVRFIISNRLRMDLAN